MKRAVAMAVVAAVGTAMVGAVQVMGEGGGTPSSLVPVPPCRLLDTRPDPDTVGPVSTPILDLRNEVAAYQDHGMLGFALHPAFESNGLMYAFFVVVHDQNGIQWRLALAEIVTTSTGTGSTGSNVARTCCKT